MDPQLAAKIRATLNAQNQELANLRTAVAELQKRPRSITEEIDSIPGRRIVYTLSGDQSFTISQLGLRATPITMLVSQDGPFVMTHYPCIGWYPNAPSTATNLGMWMPISTYPLPTQQLGQVSADTLDRIDISYELIDGGSQRQFQNLTVGPNAISTRDNLIPLPVPTLFAPNATIQVVITYNDIFFSTGPATDTTGGNLHVDLLGYRIVNL